MPVCLSGVMLVENTLPNGVASSRPPAIAGPLSDVWQARQSPSLATYSPRATNIVFGSEVTGALAATLPVPGAGSAA